MKTHTQKRDLKHAKINTLRVLRKDSIQDLSPNYS